MVTERECEGRWSENTVRADDSRGDGVIITVARQAAQWRVLSLD
jgi:hypothetical protein